MLRDLTLLDSTLSKPERRAVDEFANLARDHFGERLVRVLLYGSRARGDCQADSDIDILVVLAGEPERGDREWVSREGGRLSTQNDTYIDLSTRLVSKSWLEELVRRELQFGLDIEAQGIEI